MKSQLLQSCQGKPHPNLPQGEGVPPKAHPNHYKPHPSLPQGEGVPPQAHPKHYKPHPNLSQGEKTSSNRLKHSRNELPPLGEGWGGASEDMAGCVDWIIILPFFATKSTKNIVFVSAFIIFFIILRSEREIRLRPVVISPGSGRSFIHTGAI